MEIEVMGEVGVDTVGEGWANAEDAAAAVAAAQEDRWIADLTPLVTEGHEISVRVEVVESGSGRPPLVAVSGAPDAEVEYEIVQYVEKLLTDSNVVWEEFCTSDEAVELATA